MVCLHQNVPLIRMGEFDIGCYDQSWIGSEIRHAADRAGEDGGQFPFDVAESVIRFLRDHCRGNVIGLDAVAEQIRCCLRAIGRPGVAGALELKAPPVYVHLGELASRSGGGFELGFYAMFGARLELLLRPGMRSLTLGGLESALDLLLGPQCESRREIAERERLRGEVVEFARVAVRRYVREVGLLRLTVEG